MAESSLSITYVELQKAVGSYLGYGATPSAWTTARSNEVDGYIQSGYRQFLYPPGLPDPTTGQSQARHTWSFLKPTSSITTAADDAEQDLPDDYGGIDGDLTYLTTDTLRTSIRVTSEGRIRDLRQGRGSSDTGPPIYAAIRPKRSDGASGQRFEILWYPTPDGAYELEYSYNALQAALTAERPYPLGGMPHAETLIESCLSKAEARGNDTSEGPHYGDFIKHLAASVAHDRSIRQPESFGYCGDTSDRQGFGFDPQARLVTVAYTPTP